MSFIWKLILTFLAITGAVYIAQNGFHFETGDADYWDHHGVFLLIFLTLFPRLTLLFSSIPFGGVMWWIGFFFAPRLLVAILATAAYWNQNPILVIFAWLVALGGESGEKTIVGQRIYYR